MYKTSSLRRLLKNHAGLLIFVFGMAFFRTAVADWNHVPSGSMEPTLFDGDWVWVDKTSYGPTIPFANVTVFKHHDPERGDIVTFVPPHTSDLYVKRVVGIPGDRVQFSGRDITVNDQVLAYKATRISTSNEIGLEHLGTVDHLIQYSADGKLPTLKGTIVVPRDHYFVLGDHRNNSADSRYWGLVQRDNIMGKVTYIALSISSKRPLSDRIAVTIQ